MTADIASVWEHIFNLAESKGAAPINKHPGCWECRLDEHWLVAMNGHPEPMETQLCPSPVTVQPFTVYVEFNGWPAGVFNMYSGEFAAGSMANLDAFQAALIEATP